ncbi:nitroreductase family deazaflavin-dependent oxidoreductase [Nocardiopsis sp. CNT-189]|uniref:nitroreductase/quinone reductase family protein n=1 Tax=Nocardiopsis oceanisediminis TaxID=2816862 RepID=UPI003B32E5A4
MGNEPKVFRAGRLRHTFDALVERLAKYGCVPSDVWVLTTRGRTSGLLRSTPINLLENEQGRFLVAPYGEVGWVRNIRKDGFATLRQGGWLELVSVVEVGPERAAPVLREYLQHPRVAVVGPYFQAAPDSPVEWFRDEAHRHPVFEIVRSTTVRI